MTVPQHRENRILGDEGGLKSGPPVCFAECSSRHGGGKLIIGMVILRKRIVGLSRSTLERFVLRARRAVHLRGTVNVLVTNSTELHVLNRRFRGADKATDVLSFPSPALPSSTAGVAGEVAISADIARDNAKHLGHSVADEVKILALHGILHLVGFDHEHDNGEMAREEARLRRLLKLQVGLIERSEPRAFGPAARKERGRRPPGTKRRSA
jgi:probable rRNA maturation factor